MTLEQLISVLEEPYLYSKITQRHARDEVVRLLKAFESAEMRSEETIKMLREARKIDPAMLDKPMTI